LITSALRWIGGTDGYLELVDQRKLPGEFVKIECRDVETLFDAIKTLAVRGAPAIGVAAGYGVVLAVGKTSGSIEKGVEAINSCCEYLGSARPTAVNLFWALERVKKAAESFALNNPAGDIGLLRQAVFAEANLICEEDVLMCQRIGENGERFINNGSSVLTHCNAGALATAGQGTALSVMYEAKARGKKFKVYVDETRPLLQGARLTAWELQRAGIEAVLICDNMAGWLMKQGKVDVVITGADRIAANGDTANKIGTYSLSILAKANKIPFYIAAPSSTFDLSIESGAQIPIEQRDGSEVVIMGQKLIAPEAIGVYNAAFDVTEAEQITAIITEKAVIERPDADKIRRYIT